MNSFNQTARPTYHLSPAVLFRNFLVMVILGAAIYAYSQLDFGGTWQSPNKKTGISIGKKSLIPILFTPSAVNAK